jgi:peptidoglycan/xylan/chitin deacetylase (PgdA/CDA1 family)
MGQILKKIARNFIYPNLVRSGVAKLVSNFQSKQFLILNYHGVVKQTNLSLSVNHMSESDFEKQMTFFSKNFNILSEEDFFKKLKSNDRSQKKSLLITFDDGYENNYKYAFPILKKLKIPALIFPVTSLIDSKNQTWYDIIDLTKDNFNSETQLNRLENIAANFGLTKDYSRFSISVLKTFLKTLNPNAKQDFFKEYYNIIDHSIFENHSYYDFWKILSTNQIKEMNESGLISFGSHTFNHPNLDQLKPDLILSELKDSKLQLEQIVGKTISSIAFPDGAYNNDVIEIAKKLNYDKLYAVQFKNESDILDEELFNRFSISNTTSAESVIFNVCRSFSKDGIQKN